MRTTNKLFAAAVVAATACFSATANASIFIADYASDGLWTAYNSVDETYSARFTSEAGQDGFWLVVSDGDNPRGNGSDYTVLYGDLNANRITAYAYDGLNGNGSYNTTALLGTFDNAFSSGGTLANGVDTTAFSLDVAEINSVIGGDFKGVQTGPEAGLWFHKTTGSDFTYGADGSITNYAFSSQDFVDRGNTATRHIDPTRACRPGSTRYLCQTGTQATGGLVGAPGAGGGSVPAPGGLALVLLGLAGLGRKLRKQA